MKPDDVARSYDAIADRWNDAGFPRENGIAQHQRAIAFTELRGAALDIGCGGSGRIMELLLTTGFKAEGLDLSPRMIELAKRRHPETLFHHADICHWEFPHHYDLISAWDSIWHVPLNFQRPVLEKILAGLSDGGVLIFTIGGVDGPSEVHDSSMGPPMYHASQGITATLQSLARNSCACRHLKYDQFPEPHVYIIAQKIAGEDAAMEDNSFRPDLDAREAKESR